ncbi:MAG: 50S ribosomal protein L21 [Patescibacteria group bacterium]
MKFAIIRTGGKQYPVHEGRQITIEKLPTAAGKSVTFSDVLLYADGKQTVLGTPKVAQASVTGTVVVQQRAPKVRVVKYKNKTRYRRVIGHRQYQTKVKIEKISHSA